jgi:hypothetical protein
LLFRAVGWQQAKRQKEAVVLFLKAHEIEFDNFDILGSPENRQSYSRTNIVAPKWLRSLVGDDFFLTVESIHIDHLTKWLTKEKMSCLHELKDLHVLELHDIRIEDGWQHLEQLKSLRKLILERCNLTDAELEYLGNMDQLVFVDLSRTLITDAGLRRLFSLKHLEILDLSRTDVTDDGVAKLQNALPNCDIRY